MTRTVILLFLCLPLVAPRPLLKTFRGEFAPLFIGDDYPSFDCTFFTIANVLSDQLLRNLLQFIIHDWYVQIVVSQGDIKSSNRPTTTPTSRDPYVVVEEVEVRVSDDISESRRNIFSSTFFKTFSASNLVLIQDFGEFDSGLTRQFRSLLPRIMLALPTASPSTSSHWPCSSWLFSISSR